MALAELTLTSVSPDDLCILSDKIPIKISHNSGHHAADVSLSRTCNNMVEFHSIFLFFPWFQS